MSFNALKKRGFLDERGNQMRFSMSSHFEASKRGRRSEKWDAPSTGPNTALEYDIDTLRDRSRASYRNTPWISRGVDTLVSNEVGTGIIPRSSADNEEFRSQIQKLWHDWSFESDADGVLPFYGQLAQIARSRVSAGECFIRIRPRRLSDGLTVPLQIQVIEPEFVPVDLSEELPNGRKVKNGIEFDRIGRRRAYYMHKDHPGDSNKFSVDIRDFVRIPAKNVLHHYLPIRPGQIRGEPWTVQALVKSFSFDKYDDAELTRKETRAQYTGFIKRPQYDDDDYAYDPVTGEPMRHDLSGVPVADVEPGTMGVLYPGEDVLMMNGDQSTDGYYDFVRQQLLGIAAGFNLPYELLTGDMRNINDRSLRAVLNEFQRFIEQWQQTLTIPQVCRPVWVAFCDMAILSGAVVARDYQENRRNYIGADFRPQGWKYLHPLQDAQATKEWLSMGLTSRSSEAAKRGRDVEEIDKENVIDRDREKANNLEYDKGSPNIDQAATDEMTNQQ